MQRIEKIGKESGLELAEALERLSLNPDFKLYLEFETTLRRNLVTLLLSPQFSQPNPAMHTAYIQGQIKTFDSLGQYREDFSNILKNRSF